MAAFTTWSALKTAFLDEWSNNPTAARVKSYALTGGTGVTMRDFGDFRSFLEYIDLQISIESGGITENLARFGT